MSEDVVAVDAAVAEPVVAVAKEARSLWYVISDAGKDVGLIKARGPADAVTQYLEGRVVARKAEIEDAMKLSEIGVTKL